MRPCPHCNTGHGAATFRKLYVADAQDAEAEPGLARLNGAKSVGTDGQRACGRERPLQEATAGGIAGDLSGLRRSPGGPPGRLLQAGRLGYGLGSVSSRVKSFR